MDVWFGLTMIGLILTVITIGAVIGAYLAKRIPKRAKGAKDRCRIVYEGFLIKEINRMIKAAEEFSKMSFAFDEYEDEIKLLSLKSTKNCLDRLKKVSKNYEDMLDIATSRVGMELDKMLKVHYKEIKKEKCKKIKSYLGGEGNVVKRLHQHFRGLEKDLIKTKVKGENISFNWFKKLPRYASLDKKERLNDLLREADCSLESLFQELDWRLGEEASIRFLDKYREVYLNEAKNTKKKLEKGAKKLKSKLGFVYGIGDEQTLQDFKRKMNKKSEATSCGRRGKPW